MNCTYNPSLENKEQSNHKRETEIISRQWLEMFDLDPELHKYIYSIQIEPYWTDTDYDIVIIEWKPGFPMRPVKKLVKNKA